MFGWDFEENALSRFWRWSLIKICVWTCDMTQFFTLERWTQPTGPLCLWQRFDYILTLSDYFCRKDKKYKKDVDNSWHLYRSSRSLSVSLLVFVFVFVLLWNLCACPGQSGSNGIPMQFSWFAQSPINKSAFQGLALFTRRWRILSLIMDQSNITWPALFPNFIF